jgi:DNA topoisomerase-1
MTKVLIVESPAKASTISKYLGKRFKVVSSVGHVRDLPKSSLGVDVENGFEPTYQVMKDKEKVVRSLKAAAKDAEVVYLAPDPDREGEAIAWHLSEILKGAPIKRVEFNEITKSAVVRGVDHPREIDMNRVSAQQARRVLDRLVGYKISPVLWRKIRRGLSAGRVQSVAVRLICDREQAIQAFVAEEYWSIAGEFVTEKGDKFTAELVKIGGEPIKIGNEAAASEIIAAVRKAAYAIAALQSKKTSRHPYPPFITSTLQQEANRKLGFSGQRTMRIAQELYEGVSLGKTSEGLITYMRTDSVRCTSESVSNARRVIGSLFGAAYVPESPNYYKSRKDAQGAHEAIRPTDPSRHPDAIKQFLTNDQYKIYKLIWQRFIASQMASAQLVQHSIDVEGDKFLFRATATETIFDGFLKLYEESADQNCDKASSVALPQGLSEGQRVTLSDAKGAQHFTKPPARYTDATLIRALEEDGIGRPSTYAPIIETIITRGYVRREKRVLIPTEWAFVVIELMNKYFPDIVDVGFTRDMEEKLDSVEEGSQDWRTLVKGFWEPLKAEVDTALGTREFFKPKPEESGIACEMCGSPMVYRTGKFGRFLACSAFPKCRNTKQIDKNNHVVENGSGRKASGRKCPEPGCDGDLLVKVSRYGTQFLGCSRYPKCKHTEELQTKCPKCGMALESRVIKNRRKILICSSTECDFVLWGKPLLETCDLCGYFLAERKMKGGASVKFCTNKACDNSKRVEEVTLEEE